MRMSKSWLDSVRQKDVYQWWKSVIQCKIKKCFKFNQTSNSFRNQTGNELYMSSIIIILYAVIKKHIYFLILMEKGTLQSCIRVLWINKNISMWVIVFLNGSRIELKFGKWNVNFIWNITNVHRLNQWEQSSKIHIRHWINYYSIAAAIAFSAHWQQPIFLYFLETPRKSSNATQHIIQYTLCL